MVFIFAALSLYWAVIYNVQNNLAAIEVHVVDFDGQIAPYDNVTPIVGPEMTDLIRQIHATPLQPSLGYRIIPPAQYNCDPIAVRQGVYNWDAWAAVIINPNATALLLEAVTIGNASYDPTGAIQYIIQTARQETNTYNYILPGLQKLTSQFASQFGASWSKMLLTGTTFSPLALAQAPTAVNPGVVPLQIDLRPFEPSTATPAVSIGLIYLIIVAFLSFTFFLPIHNVRLLYLAASKYEGTRTRCLLIRPLKIEICPTTRTSAAALLASDHLAVAGHRGLVPSGIPDVLASIARLWGAVLAAFRIGN
jgi:hypothetical protein